jgi:hypothetical protein
VGQLEVWQPTRVASSFGMASSNRPASSERPRTCTISWRSMPSEIVFERTQGCDCAGSRPHGTATPTVRNAGIVQAPDGVELCHGLTWLSRVDGGGPRRSVDLAIAGDCAKEPIGGATPSRTPLLPCPFLSVEYGHQDVVTFLHPSHVGPADPCTALPGRSAPRRSFWA